MTEEKGIQQCLDDRFSMAQAWRWCWHWKVWRLSVAFVLQTVLCQGGDWRGEQKIHFKKRKKWIISKEAVKNSSGHFRCNFRSQISLKSIKQVHIQQMKPKLATKVSLITVCKTKRWVVSTLLIILPTSALRNYSETRSRSNVIERDDVIKHFSSFVTNVGFIHLSLVGSGGQKPRHIILGLGNVDCTSWLRVGTSICF